MTDAAAPHSLFTHIPLNPVQKDAVIYTGGPQLVFAGAGTGKTRVLTAKIAFLVHEKKIGPGNIFAATFTNKAASEMRSRVESLINAPCDGLWIGTFHSMGARILRREAPRLNYSHSFSIFDEDDQRAVLRKILKEQAIDERSMTPSTLADAISRYKNACIPPEKVELNTDSFYQKEIVRLYGLYQQQMCRQQAMDFDDLITNLVYLLRDHGEVLEKYQQLFEYILVDEYQDTNRSQFHLVKLLAGTRQQVFAVGDDDQSIYGWRGADIENILSFETAFPGTRVFKLEQNYRSTQHILNFANAAIAPNQHRASKQLWCEKQSGGPVRVVRYRSDRQEAEEICETIEKEISSKKSRAGDIAVLFRTNAQSRAFEEALRKKQIPYILVGGMSFYERKEIKDCLAYLRVLVNPMDNVAFERILNVPPRGIGDKTVQLLYQAAQKYGGSLLKTVLSDTAESTGARGQKGLGQVNDLFVSLLDSYSHGLSPQNLLQQALRSSGYVDMLENEQTEEGNERLENINELINAMTSWTQENEGKTLIDFLEQVSLVSDIDSWDQAQGMVNLMTLHCAKGLEFKRVFLVGLEDGILPSKLNFDEPDKLEEERRLFYVGITRAMEEIECSYVDQRWRFGSVMPMEPTRFLGAVPGNLYQFVNRGEFQARTESATPRGKFAARADAGPPRVRFDEFSQETVEFRMGQHVRHKDYGQGKIVNISGFGPDMRMTILFADGIRRKVMAKFANLETP